MADAEARFVINVDAGPAEAGAGRAASALEALRKKITDGTKALQEMQATASRLKSAGDVVSFEKVGKELQRAQGDAAKLEAKIAGLTEKLAAAGEGKSASGIRSQIADAQKGLAAAQERAGKLSGARDALAQKPAVKAYQDVTAAIKEKQRSLADAQVELSRLGGSMSDSAGKAKGLRGWLSGVSERLKEAGGPAGEAASSIEALGGSFKSLAALGVVGLVVAAAAAFAVLAAAVVYAAAKVAAFALEVSDAARSARILQDATAGSAEGGKALADSIGRVYQRVGGSREEIQGLALDLRRAGLQGAALEDSIEAVRATSRVFGQQAGGAIQGLIDRATLARRGVLGALDLRGTGLAFADVAGALAKNAKASLGTAAAALQNGTVKVEDFTRAMRDASRVRTGAALEKMAIALPEQFAHAKDNLAQIFKVDNTPLLRGLQRILSVLDESTASGKALRKLAASIFQPLFNAAEKLAPLFEAIFYGVAISVLDFTIHVLDAAIALKGMIPQSLVDKLGDVNNAFDIGSTLGDALVVVAVALAAAFAVVALSIGLAVAPFVLLFLAVRKVWNLLLDFSAWWTKFTLGASADNKGFASAGKDMTDGIVEGITKGQPAVNAALKSLAAGGLGAFEKEAKIASPSKAFRESARWIPEGAALGVEDGAPRMSSAVAALGSSAPLEDAAAGGGGGAGGGAAVPVNVYVDARGTSAEQARENKSLLQAMVEILQDAGRQAGVPVRVVGAMA